MYIFTFIYNEYIGPYFLSHVVLRFSPVNSMSASVAMNSIFMDNAEMNHDSCE
jgi:hypothetical protein